jgi:hypothetical protein
VYSHSARAGASAAVFDYDPQAFPWSGLAPSALAAVSVMYSPFFVLPYHRVPGQW